MERQENREREREREREQGDLRSHESTILDLLHSCVSQAAEARLRQAHLATLEELHEVICSRRENIKGFIEEPGSGRTVENSL